MSMSPWRRLRYTRTPGVVGTQEGSPNKSHHLRCTPQDSKSSQSSSSFKYKSRAQKTLNSWPGDGAHPNKYELDFSSKFGTPHTSLPHSYDNQFFHQPSPKNLKPLSPTYESTCSIRRPPRCQLPSVIRKTTLILYISIFLFFFTTTTCAFPLESNHQATDLRLRIRQAIPDSSGNTGNEPAPVASQPPPRPASTSSSSITTSTTSTFTPTSTTTQPPNLAGPNGNANQPGGVGENPNAPPERLTLTSLGPLLGVEAIAGIAAGGFVLVCICIAVAIWAYKRRPANNVDEIPIRRSKLGSRLGFRIFGEGLSRNPSRSSSRRGSKEKNNEKQNDIAWLDKGTISRPKEAWLENGLLSVPKPGYLSEERGAREDVAPWVEKGDISGPRPGRPRSAEPLGRLSGMGSGMGYLK